MISGGGGVVFVWPLADLSIQLRDDPVKIRIFGTAIAAFNAVPALFVNHWIAQVVARSLSSPRCCRHGHCTVIEWVRFHDDRLINTVRIHECLDSSAVAQ